MDNIIKALHNLGENFEVKDGHIRVKLSGLLGKLDIKFDYAKGQWIYHDRQVADVLSIFTLVIWAGVNVSEHNILVPSLLLAFALSKVATSILKTNRVSAIKQQVAAINTLATHGASGCAIVDN